MAYATTTELADYLGMDEEELPDDADRLLDRASEMIDYYTLDRIDEDDADHEKAAEKSVSAQVEYWMSTDEDVDISEMPGNFSIGSFSMGTASESEKLPELSSRAKRYLMLAGLMHAGVDLR